MEKAASCASEKGADRRGTHGCALRQWRHRARSSGDEQSPAGGGPSVCSGSRKTSAQGSIMSRARVLYLGESADDEPQNPAIAKMRRALEEGPRLGRGEELFEGDPAGQARLQADQRAGDERERSELRRAFRPRDVPESYDARIHGCLKTAARHTARFHTAADFRHNYEKLAADTDRRIAAGQRRQFLLYDTHDTVDSVALPVHDGHSEDPLENRLFRGGHRDREGRLDSTGPEYTSAGHSEDDSAARLYRGNKRDRTGALYDAAERQQNGHSEDPLELRRYGGEPRSTRDPRPSEWAKFDDDFSRLKGYELPHKKRGWRKK